MLRKPHIKTILDNFTLLFLSSLCTFTLDHAIAFLATPILQIFKSASYVLTCSSFILSASCWTTPLYCPSTISTLDIKNLVYTSHPIQIFQCSLYSLLPAKLGYWPAISGACPILLLFSTFIQTVSSFFHFLNAFLCCLCTSKFFQCFIYLLHEACLKTIYRNNLFLLNSRSTKYILFFKVLFINIYNMCI